MMNIHDTNYTGPSGDLARVNAVYQVGPLPVNDLGLEKVTVFYHEVNWMHFQDCAVTCMFYPTTTPPGRSPERRHRPRLPR